MSKKCKSISVFLAMFLSVQISIPSVCGKVDAANDKSPVSSSTVYQEVMKTDKVNNRIIVRYKDKDNGNASKDIKSKILGVENSVGKKLKKLEKTKELNSGEMCVYQIDEKDDIQSAIKEFKKNEEVEYVQEDYKLSSFDIPTDSRFNEQWSLNNDGQNIYEQTGVSGVDINVLDAWSKTKGSEEVVVGIIDTGIDISHSDLCNNIFINSSEVPDNGIDDDQNGFIDDISGWDFANSDNTVYDSASDLHGTHVAGIIGADENGTGICGVASNVKLLPVKFIEGNTGYTSDAISAINYCKSIGVDIVNMSWGSTSFNEALKDTMEESGMLFITAAGNFGVSSSTLPVYPACFDLPNKISVAAIDNTGKLASFSSYGNNIDVAAPGLNILSNVPNNQYGTLSGTSMACPNVTGIAALLKSYEPDITVSEMVERIKDNVVKSYKLDEKVATGGRVNANATLENIVPQAEVGNIEPTEPYTLNNNEYKDIQEIINASKDNSSDTNGKIGKSLIAENSSSSEPGANSYSRNQLGIDGVREDIQAQNISPLSYTYEVEPNDTSSTGMTVPIGSTFGTAEAATGNDWYIVYLEANKQYTFSLKGIQTGDDLGLFLFKPDLTDADFSDNLYNADENITYTTSVAGYYYLDAYCFARGSSTSHDYQMLIYPNDTAPDSYEPNDSSTTATIISNNTPVSGTINIAADEDWYVIDTTTTGKLTVSLESIPSNCDYDIIVYDENGSYIGGSYNFSNQDEKANVLMINSGEYYIRVYSYSGTNPTSNYSLNAVVANPDSYETNDYIYEAKGVEIGTSAFGTIDNTRDQDWFMVTIDDATSYYSFELENIPSNRDYDMYIYNNSGSYVAGSSAGSNNDELINTQLATGKYYVKIYPYSGYSDTLSYTFSAYKNNSLNVVLPYMRANAGDQIVVPVCLENIPQEGISSLDFKVNYDSSALSYTGYEAGALTNTSDAMIEANDTGAGVNILYLDNSTTFSNPITSSGELIRLKFTVNTTTTDGAYKLTYNDGWSFGKQNSLGEIEGISNACFKEGMIMVGSYGLSSMEVDKQPTMITTLEAIIYGDVNNDGSCNALDFANMRLYLLGRTPNPFNTTQGDVNGNGSVDSIDFGYMRKYLLGQIIKFPADTSSGVITGNSISLSNWEGSTSGSVALNSETTHAINTDIPAGKIVIVSLSGSSLPDNKCLLELYNSNTGVSLVRYGGWYAKSRMAYFVTTDSTNKRYYAKVKSEGYSINYTINVVVVNKISSFSKLDSEKNPTSNLTYVMSNSPELLDSDYYKGEWGYYLQRSKVQGNANIYWEHQNVYSSNMKFGVLLWNKDSIPLTITLNRRSAKSYTSAGNNMETACAGVWQDWFNGVKQSDDISDNFETTSISIPKYDSSNPSASAKWIFMNTVANNSDLVKSTFNGVMSISIKNSAGSLYTGQNLYCDTYVMTPGYENQVIPAITKMERASTTGTLRGSGVGAMLSTTISGTTSITSSNPYNVLLTGYDMPSIQSGEQISITDYTKSGSTSTLPNCYNYGVVYKVTFSNFSSNSTIKGRIKCNTKTNPQAAVSQYGGCYVSGYRETPTATSPFKKLIYSGEVYDFDTNVPKGQSVTYYFVVSGMSSLPLEISFYN